MARSLGRGFLLLVGYSIAASAALAGIAALFLAVEGGTAKTTVASFLFGGAALIFVFAVGSDGGTRGRRYNAIRGHGPPQTSFTPAVVALGVIGIGVLTVWLWP